MSNPNFRRIISPDGYMLYDVRLRSTLDVGRYILRRPPHNQPEAPRAIYRDLVEHVRLVIAKHGLGRVAYIAITPYAAACLLDEGKITLKSLERAPVDEVNATHLALAINGDTLPLVIYPPALRVHINAQWSVFSTRVRGKRQKLWP